MKTIKKETLYKEMDKRSNARVAFSKGIECLAYDCGKVKETVMTKGETYWLGANPLDFKSRFPGTVEKLAPKKWRKTVLIPFHNNEDGLTSIDQKPGLFYCKLEDVLEYGFFTKIPKMLKFPKIKEAVDKIEPLIIEQLSQKLKPVIVGNKLLTEKYFKSFEDEYYLVFEDMLKKYSKIDLHRHLDMSDETFNQVQALSLSLLKKCFLKHKISKKVIDEVIGDSGCWMFKI